MQVFRGGRLALFTGGFWSPPLYSLGPRAEEKPNPGASGECPTEELRAETSVCRPPTFIELKEEI
jgi:hypothetical protein